MNRLWNRIRSTFRVCLSPFSNSTRVDPTLVVRETAVQQVTTYEEYTREQLRLLEEHFMNDHNLMQQLMQENLLLNMENPRPIINTQHLRKGQRYLFVENAPHQMKKICYRANLEYIINKTIVVRLKEKYINTIHKQMLHSMPLPWIVQVVTLDQITRKKMRLPPEIIDIIDSYL